MLRTEFERMVATWPNTALETTAAPLLPPQFIDLARAGLRRFQLAALAGKPVPKKNVQRQTES